MAVENAKSLPGTNGDPATADAEIIVVGAGVVGLAIAGELARRGRDVLLLDQHHKAGTEVSSRNSEVVHAGLYYPPESLRARLCVAGRKKLLAFCADVGVPVRPTGKILVATTNGEIAQLDAIAATAARNGAPALQRLSVADVHVLEPDVQCVAALLSPGTAVVDSHQLIVALEGQLAELGGTLALGSKVVAIAQTGDGLFHLDVASASTTTRLTSRALVLAGGLGATALGDMLVYRQGYRPPRTYPAKGHYYALRGRVPFTHLIYPVPHGAWLGIHLTLNVAGQARFGPDIEWRDTVTYDFEDPDGARVAKFEQAVRRYWPGLPHDALLPDTTSVRPKIYRQGEPVADFTIHGASEHGLPGLVALYGIESPGLTSCLAIAEYVAERLDAA